MYYQTVTFEVPYLKHPQILNLLQDKEPRGIIPLENVQVREVADRNKPNCFELYSTGNDVIKACKTDSEGKVVEGKHTVYRMSAATQEEKEDWIKCIR